MSAYAYMDESISTCAYTNAHRSAFAHISALADISAYQLRRCLSQLPLCGYVHHGCCACVCLVGKNLCASWALLCAIQSVGHSVCLPVYLSAVMLACARGAWHQVMMFVASSNHVAAQGSGLKV